MLHGEMATVTVRVVPRSGRTRGEASAAGDVSLRTGSRSRTKVFAVRGLDAAELEARLRRSR
jgi:hypothetical protein